MEGLFLIFLNMIIAMISSITILVYKIIHYRQLIISFCRGGFLWLDHGKLGTKYAELNTENIVYERHVI